VGAQWIMAAELPLKEIGYFTHSASGISSFQAETAAQNHPEKSTRSICQPEPVL
jgi:hypothetical protein